MKTSRFEHLGHVQRQYHRLHPWRLSHNGLYIPHSYAETKPDDLSWWDDAGFILNKRRVIVWWVHPRLVYSDAIDELSREEVGDDPDKGWLTHGSTKNYKRVGKSRKKIISYTSRQPSEEQQHHYDRLRDCRDRLAQEGIEFEVKASWTRERLNWATSIELVAPLEVRNTTGLVTVAELSRRLLLGKTTLEKEFPDYCYNRADWLHEQKSERTK
jgi:hypothetical protein